MYDIAYWLRERSSSHAAPGSGWTQVTGIYGGGGGGGGAGQPAIIMTGLAGLTRGSSWR